LWIEREKEREGRERICIKDMREKEEIGKDVLWLLHSNGVRQDVSVFVCVCVSERERERDGDFESVSDFLAQHNRERERERERKCCSGWFSIKSSHKKEQRETKRRI
jgi:hypothetical protein